MKVIRDPDQNRIALRNNHVYIVQASILGSILVNLLLVLGSALLAGSVTDVDLLCNTAEGQLLACLLFVSVFVVLMPTYDPETGSTSSTNYRSGSVDLGSSSFSSQHLPSRTIRFADDQDRERRSDSIYKLNNIAELETVEPSDVGDMMMDRGRRSGETPRSSYTRPNSYQPLLNSRTHSRSISVSSSIGFQSRDSSMSRASRHTTALHLLREHRLSMDQLVHPRSHAEHSETDWKAPVAMLIITSLLMSMCGEFLIALCISPLTVMAGWAMRKDLDLAFNTFEMVTLAGTVLLVNLLILNDGSSSLKTSGLKGALMCACYVIFGELIQGNDRSRRVGFAIFQDKEVLVTLRQCQVVQGKVDRVECRSNLVRSFFFMLHDNQQDLLDIDAGLLSNLKICLREAEWSKSSTPQVATLQKCDKKLYNARTSFLQWHETKRVDNYEN
uniref:Sodium/calcium exchanger membrane region domain-containing protein n=1 Tax=Fusarium oxysporum (strain Fo5176) TaxID=660025 RepID=A0A0D2XY10_FUSOF